MKLEDFNNLTDEEKSAFLAGADGYVKQIEDLTAERDSFKTENETLTKSVESTQKELKATKELNITMARKINVGAKEDPETTIYNFMKGFK